MGEVTECNANIERVKFATAKYSPCICWLQLHDVRMLLYAAHHGIACWPIPHVGND